MTASAEGPEPAPPPHPGDDGVITRVARRNTVAAGCFGGAVLLVALTAFGLPGWATTPAAGFVAAVAVVVLAVPVVLLGRRARRWRAVAGRTDPDAFDRHGSPAVVAEPRPLHPMRPGQPLRRRRPAVLLPIRADLDGLRDGEVLVLHARPDGAVPSAGEDYLVAGAGAGPYLLLDPATGAVFAAERGLLAVI